MDACDIVTSTNDYYTIVRDNAVFATAASVPPGAIARLGSLQVWRSSLSDRRHALDDYLGALALGGTRRLPQLFEAAGARLAWTAGDIAPLVDLVEEELSALEA